MEASRRFRDGTAVWLTRRAVTVWGVLFAAVFSSRARAAGAAAAAPAPPPDPVPALIRGLADDDWKARERAEAQLASLGEAAEAPLRERLKDARAGAEERSRIEAVLKRVEEARRSGAFRFTLRQPAAAPAEVLAAIARQTKISFAPGTDNLAKDARPFDADFAAVPAWQALLQTCAKAGLDFHSVNDAGQIVLQPGSPDTPAAPAAAAGAFLVTVNRVEVNLSRGRDFAGQKPMNARNNDFQNPPCRLYLFAWGEPRLKPIRWSIDSVEECVTDNGKSLAARGGFGPVGGSVASGRVNDRNETHVALSGDVEGAKRIQRLKLNARFVLRRATQTLEVPDILTVRNSKHLLGGFPIEIVHVNKIVDGQYGYEIVARRGSRTQADWELFKSLMDQSPCRLLDAGGKALGFRGGGGSYGPDEVRLTNTLATEPLGGGGKAAGEPVKLVWEFPSEVEQVPVALEFHDVPLP